MPTLFKAFVRDRSNRNLVVIESEYETKAAFIRDLKANGYIVDYYKVKKAAVFNWIMNNTDCSPKDWRETN